MKGVLLTSSVLILAVFLVRVLFRNTISRRMQYALWGLVLVRLLLPFNLPPVEHNVLSAAAPVQEVIAQNIETQTVFVPVERMTVEEFQAPSYEIPPQVEVVGQRVWYAETEETIAQYRMLTGEEALKVVWIAGMAVMAIWFLISNLRFRNKLHGARVPYVVEGCKYPVYLVEEGLPSPCLFGLVKPAIYLTPAAVRDDTTLRHVLAHETTHARHLDPLWAFLRGLCLVVYWFDPLVWTAAFASRTDCELACDEGALKRLGEEDRIPYGKTLLSLIPVRKGPASPLLSATTMTSDKKRLTDRIKRIAENRQSVQAAIFMVIAIAAVVSIMTFTGAKTTEGPAQTENSVQPLSVEEIAWFNTEFFNGESFNIHNQFLSSTYKSPEYIDLSALFYTGGGASSDITEEERTLLADTYYQGSMILEVDCTKVTAADMDAVLLEHTGVGLEGTRKLHLDYFDYLADYDAYYHFHGDTNYRGEVTIVTGEREGNMVRLYYNDTFFADGWKCVTLGEQSAGEYWFVSNLSADVPDGVIKSQLLSRKGEPDNTVKLSNITVSAPQKVEPADIYSYSQTPGTDNAYSYLDYEGYTIFYWEDSAGVVHFSYKKQNEDTVYDVLQCTAMPEGYEYGPFIETYHFGLMGHSGFRVHSYRPGEVQGGLYTRYYEFVDDELYLVAATMLNQEVVLDAEGDGDYELYFDSDYQRLSEGTPNFYFEQDGAICGVDLREVASAAYPEWDFFSFGSFDWEKGCFYLNGNWQREDKAYVTAYPELYFTGEEFLFYKDDRETVDHLMGETDAPDDVLKAAKSDVERLYLQETEAPQEADWPDPRYDDWRIENLELDEVYSFAGGSIEVYNMNYEFHAAEPAKVSLAGGMYLKEDDWVMPNYPNCWYIYFVNEDGARRHLKTAMANDRSPGVEWFDEEVERLAEKEGLITISGD